MAKTSSSPGPHSTAPRAVKSGPLGLATIKCGFLPLIDSAILVIAREKGFDRAHGLKLHLLREKSWMSIRDGMDRGAFDCAHMSAGTPLAMRLGLGAPRSQEPVFVPFTMGRGGTAIVLSSDLAAALERIDSAVMATGGMGVAHSIKTLLQSPDASHPERGSGLASVIAARLRVGETPLTFSVPYHYASHNYDLRYWLASAGLDPNRDVSIVVMARGHMLQALQSGRIQGFIIAEPWCSLAVAEGLGHIAATKSQLWPDGPEKVLGVRQRWAEDNPDLLDPLIRALDDAARWLDDMDNRKEAAHLLGSEKYLGLPEQIIADSLYGRITRRPGARPLQDDSYFVFHRNGANFPWCSHAMWMLTQMIRWGDIKDPVNLAEIATEAWRPDIYRDALSGRDGLEVPAENLRPELHQGGFFATQTFDPADPLGYLDSFELHARRIPTEAFAMDGDEDALA